MEKNYCRLLLYDDGCGMRFRAAACCCHAAPSMLPPSQRRLSESFCLPKGQLCTCGIVLYSQSYFGLGPETYAFPTWRAPDERRMLSLCVCECACIAQGRLKNPVQIFFFCRFQAIHVFVPFGHHKTLWCASYILFH